ncbi:MAG TPA: polyphenol oxidase family protein [Candidatus Binatia bacterium]
MLVPLPWRSVPALVCGFGSRSAAPPPGTILLEEQLHGTAVIDPEGLAARIDSRDGLPLVDARGDALIARRGGMVVGVRTADCVPLLLVATSQRWAAAVHAGWRGTLAGIAAKAVEAAKAGGIEPRDLAAALGPSIGPCCYEVSTELAASFRDAGLPVVAATQSGKPHLDLRAANRLLLERSGVGAANIFDAAPCTRCASDVYHSFRADPSAGGRQISWIGWA